METEIYDPTLLLRADIAQIALKELFEYFKGRKWRDLSSRSYSGPGAKYLSWNIKVYQNDPSGKSGPCPISPKYDILWECYAEKREGFFWQCCEDGLLFIGDTKDKDHALDCIWDGADYILRQDGRSGGWLVLTNLNDTHASIDVVSCETEPNWIASHVVDVFKSDYNDVNQIKDSIDTAYAHIAWLKKLRVFCESLDTFNATEEWNHQCNFRRNLIEEDWIASDFSDFDGDELQGFLDHPDVPESVKEQIRAYIK